MGNVANLARLISTAVNNAARRSRVEAVPYKGNTVTSRGETYKPEFAAGTEAIESNTVVVVIENGTATVIGYK